MKTAIILLIALHLPIWSGLRGNVTGKEQETIGAPKVVRFGRHLYRVTFPYRLRTNVGILTGADGVLLIDPGFSETVEPLRGLLREMGGGEIRFIINTHNHGDHIKGNVIAGPRTTLVGLGTLEALEKKGILKQEKGSYRMAFNGEAIRIIPAPGTHSDTDIMVHFMGPDVVYMGDLLLSESFPAVSRSIDPYLGILDDALTRFPGKSLFVSGHGKELDLQGLVDYREMLSTTIDLVRQAMWRGKTADVMVSEKLLDAYSSYNHRLDWLTTEYWIRAVADHYRR